MRTRQWIGGLGGSEGAGLDPTAQKSPFGKIHSLADVPSWHINHIPESLIVSRRSEIDSSLAWRIATLEVSLLLVIVEPFLLRLLKAMSNDLRWFNLVIREHIFTSHWLYVWRNCFACWVNISNISTCVGSVANGDHFILCIVSQLNNSELSSCRVWLIKVSRWFTTTVDRTSHPSEHIPPSHVLSMLSLNYYHDPSDFIKIETGKTNGLLLMAFCFSC